MIGLVFVDSNVLVYARDTRDAARHSAACAWMATLWRERTGRLSAQVLSEYYQTVTCKLRPALDREVAWSDVRELRIWQPQAIDVAVLTDARDFERRYRLSWWDALIAAAAVRQSCAFLLSEDFQDGMVIGSTRVLNPFKHAIGEQTAMYAALPEVRSLRRGRGRPRKIAVA